MTESDVLARGMPALLNRKARWHAVVRRSAPALAAWATLMLVELYVLVASGDRDIDIDSSPTVADWSVLVALAALLPVMAAVAFAVSRVVGAQARALIAYAAIAVGLASDTYQADGWTAAGTEAVDVAVILAILAATGTGLGAILAWALRTTLTHLRSAGQLLARALPVVLLTLLVFFNNTVWYIAANLETGRIWLLVSGMAAIALAFTVTESVHACRPLLTDVQPPLRRAERINVVAVTALAQSIQALVLALVTGVVFFAMGLVVLNSAVLDHLTDGNPARGHWLDIELPVDQALAHITMILIAMTFMYLSARAATDAKHRADFVDPLLDDLRATVAVHRPTGAKRYPL
ncbi:MAG: hypothetical protein AB1925_14175 [Actinomycetota bacterium]